MGQMCATEAQSHYALARLVVRAEISIRLSEIMGLKWSDISGLELSMNVERQMAILVNHHLHQMLNRENCKIDSTVVFPEKVGNLQDETCDKEWMRNLCTRAEIPSYTRYQLHNAAFTTFLKCADTGTTKAFSPHTSTKTLHYIIFSVFKILRLAYF